MLMLSRGARYTLLALLVFMGAYLYWTVIR